MSWMFLRRAIKFKEFASYHFQPENRSLCLKLMRAYHDGIHRSPLFPKNGDIPDDYKIHIVDDEIWQVSRVFADVKKDTNTRLQVTDASHSQMVNHAPLNLNDPDFDEIDNLRICGNLFYKLDKDSKEYEEYNFDFHRRKSSKKKADCRDSNMRETPNSSSSSGLKKVSKERKVKGNTRDDKCLHKFDEMEKKKKRVLTFNQLTAPYHEPFCLDIYISKASVRACIVHRATSKVVVVAHSISKDMKFDLGSTKNAAACAAVGKVLAQRALADDIHNVIYTPRKGEKLEGKLDVVIQSLMNNGVWVKVKIKKKKVRKGGLQSADYE